MCFRGVLLTTKQRTREGNWRSCINSFLLYRCASVLLFETSHVPPLTVRLFLRLFFFPSCSLYSRFGIRWNSPFLWTESYSLFFFFFSLSVSVEVFVESPFFLPRDLPYGRRLRLRQLFLRKRLINRVPASFRSYGAVATELGFRSTSFRFPRLL